MLSPASRSRRLGVQLHGSHCHDCAGICLIRLIHVAHPLGNRRRWCCCQWFTSSCRVALAHRRNNSTRATNESRSPSPLLSTRRQKVQTLHVVHETLRTVHSSRVGLYRLPCTGTLLKSDVNTVETSFIVGTSNSTVRVLSLSNNQSAKSTPELQRWTCAAITSSCLKDGEYR